MDYNLNTVECKSIFLRNRKNENLNYNLNTVECKYAESRFVLLISSYKL